MKKRFFLVFAVAALLASCSSDDLAMDTPEGGIETKSALDKIFSVEKIGDGYGYNLCTDLEGNLYYRSDSDIKKYNPSTKEITTVFSIPQDARVNDFVVDYKKNIYYLEGYDSLFKILQDGSVANITSRIPFPADAKYILISGICAAEAGNVFVTAWYDFDSRERIQKVYKISIQGDVTEVASFFHGEYNSYLKDPYLIKSKGTFVYIIPGSGEYLKINTVDGKVEELPTRPGIHAISAAHSKDNPYALSGYDIVRLRPHEATDLLIGTIPSYIKNEEGELVEIERSNEFCMNAKADVFYISANNGGSHSRPALYKLTLE